MDILSRVFEAVLKSTIHAIPPDQRVHVVYFVILAVCMVLLVMIMR